MTNDLLRRVGQLLPPAGEGAVLAAVSGGLDSMCLLHLLAARQSQTGAIVLAAHFNHQLRGNAADRDEAFVRDWCAQAGIPFFCGWGDTLALAAREGLSTEEAARQLRYVFLEETAAAQGCVYILTAHHADDNAETMLLNLLRGTGSRGLSGIPLVRGCIRRPLLEVTRAELERYAQTHQLLYVEDESNAEDLYARNLLRHKVLPVLKELNPRAVEHMRRTAAILAQENEALDAFAADLASKATFMEGALCLPCRALKTAPAALGERAVLALLARACGHRKDLTAAHVEAVLALVRGNREGVLSLPYRLRARKEGERLWLERILPPPSNTPFLLEGETCWGNWILTCEKKLVQGLPKAPGVLLNWEKIDGPLRVGPWRPGDGLLVDRGKRSLKRLFAESGHSPAARDAAPVLYVGERAVAALGVAVDREFAPVPGEMTVEITARRRAE